MKQLVIIGAGGHGRVAADVAKAMGVYSEIVFLDDSENLELPGYHVVGKVREAVRYVDGSEFFVAVGNIPARKRITTEIKKLGANIAVLIHPSAQIGSCVEIGEGAILMAGAVVNCGTSLGTGVIVNTCSSVDHDCRIGDYVHVSVGAHLAGTVYVGKCTMIGAGATVINNIRICENCIVGAGAVVVRDIQTPGVYVGVPAVQQEKD